MLPPEDQRALEDKGFKYPSNGAILPNAHLLQTPSRRYFSPSNKVAEDRQEDLREERNLINHSNKPSAIAQPKKPLTNHSGLMSNKVAALERLEDIQWGNHNPVAHSSPKTPPKPILGSAADLPEARKKLQQARNTYQAFEAHPTITNRGRRREMELQALQQDISSAKLRVDASEKAKQLQDFEAHPTISNKGRRREMELQNLRQDASSAKQSYMNSQGLDSSGQPIKLTPPAPQQSKPEPEKSWWDRTWNSVTEKASNAWDKTKSAGNYVKDHAETIGHTALDVGGMLPVGGAVFDGANAVWYLAEGDKVNAAFSGGAALASFVGAGGAVMAAKYGTKAVKGVEKLAEAEKLAKFADNGGSKTYITYALRNEKTDAIGYVGRASGKGTPEEVLAQRFAKGHHITKENPELKEFKPEVIAVQGNRAANRGAEDIWYNRFRLRGEPLRNDPKSPPLSDKLWKAKNIGRNRVEAYHFDENGYTTQEGRKLLNPIGTKVTEAGDGANILRGLEGKGYKPKPGERTFSGYVDRQLEEKSGGKEITSLRPSKVEINRAGHSGTHSIGDSKPAHFHLRYRDVNRHDRTVRTGISDKKNIVEADSSAKKQVSELYKALDTGNWRTKGKR